MYKRQHHGVTNETLVAIDRGPVRDQYGAAYFQIHRADFHAELVRRVRLLKADAILVDHQLNSIVHRQDTYELNFQNGQTISAKILVGADGLKSLVRHFLFASDAPEFTGHIAWRALISSSDLPDWYSCLLYTSPSPRDATLSRMPSSA